MQYQQFYIAADQQIRLSNQRQGKKLIVFGVAAGRIDSHRIGILYYEDANSST